MSEKNIYKRDSQQITPNSVKQQNIAGILRKSDPTPKRAKRTVSFVDSIGKVLVQIREIPKSEHDNEMHAYEETNGKHVTNKEENKPVPWRLVKCFAPDNLLNKPRPPSQSFLIEDERRTREGISSAPLFGDFDVVDNPLLYIDVLKCRNEPIRQIPLERLSDNKSGIVGERISRFSENYVKKKALQPSTSSSSPLHVLSLVDKLKQNGLIGPSVSHSRTQSLVPVQSSPIQNTMENRYPNRNHSSSVPIYPTHKQWGHDQPCTFFVYRQKGCNRGSLCRYKHDEEQRRQLLQKRRDDSVAFSLQQKEINRRKIEAEKDVSPVRS